MSVVQAVSSTETTRQTLPFGHGDTPKTSFTVGNSIIQNGNSLSDAEEDEEPDDLNTRTKRKYVKDRKLGEGTYAIVYLGHLRPTPDAFSTPVAIKKIKVNTEFRDGLSMDAIREVKYLRELHHPNIISLLDVFSSKNQNLNLVLEFLDSDMEMIIKDTSLTLSMADVKSWMLMSLRGLWWCHRGFVLHRDIKPNNLLLSSSGVLKLADFGLARSFSDPYRPMTSNVITRWYRPPELLYDLNQLELICQALGTPTEENWPGVTTLPGYHAVTNATTNNEVIKERGKDFFMNTFMAAGEGGVDLLMKMIRLDPRKRCSAREALDAPWFSQEPYPTKPANLPKKAGGKGIEKVGSDLKRKAGELQISTDETDRGKKVAKMLSYAQ